MTLNTNQFGPTFRSYEDRGGGLVTISYEHSRIHSNRAWTAFREINSLASAGTSTVLIKVADENPHLRYISVDAALSTKIKLFEGTTVSENGTAIPAYRSNRRAGDSDNGIKLFHTPTISNNGTQIDSWFIAGSVTSGAGTVNFDQEEYILKSNTNYLIQITNAGNQSGDLVLRLFWYLEDH
jgi:hypothetical protein